MNPLLGLPSGVTEPGTCRQRFGIVELEGPRPSADWLRDLAATVRGGGPRLRALSPGERADALVRATGSLASDPTLLERLEAVTGYSRPILELGLSRLAEAVVEEDVLEWHRSVPGAPGAPPAPGLVGMVAAGNIPGVALTPLVAGLLAGVPMLVKASMSEPLLAAAWQRALTRVAPELGAACAVVPWPGDATELMEAAFATVDRLLVFGSDTTVAALEARHAGRVFGYGTGLSVALISAERRDPAAAEALALDVAAWDQQGCLSPQAAFVEGSAADVAAFGALVAERLVGVETRLPRGRLTPAEAARVRNFRAEVEARRVGEGGLLLLTPGPSLAWTLVAEPAAGFRPSVLNRTLTLWPLASLSTVGERLRPWRAALQAAGVACGEERRGEIESALRGAGFGWITTLGTLQAPPLRWPNKGRDVMVDLLTPLRGGRHK